MKTIFAKLKNDTNKNLEFDSENNLAKYFKNNNKIIREYIQGIKSSYYYEKSKFIYKLK